MKIALYGIGGLYNYGCEAIVRGTFNIIKQIFGSKTEIIYYSYCYEFDKNQLNDLDIEICQLEHKWSFLERVLNKLLRVFLIPYRFGEKNFQKIASEVDCVFLIGGDIFTIPEYLRKKPVYQFYNPLVQFGHLLKRKGVKQVIFGASIGPFGSYKRACNYYFKYFKKVDLIVARENRCMEYLTANGIIDNLISFPDPAFFVEGNNCEHFGKKYIGINLSELSLKEIYGSISDNDIYSISKLLISLQKITKHKILLIPHVFSPYSSSDNDFLFLNKLYNCLEEDAKKEICLCKPISFIDAKKYIHECELIITARMHCGISAVSEMVPAIFLSYSEKTRGMVKYVYGNTKMFLRLSELENKLIPLIKEQLNILQDTNSILEKRIPIIKSELLNDELFKNRLLAIKHKE